MWRGRFKTIILLVVWLSVVTGSFAQGNRLTYYNYISDFEETWANEIVWFYTPDTFRGPVHSNDFIGLKFSPHFYGSLSTSQDHFLEYQASPYFEFEPWVNAPLEIFRIRIRI